MAIIQGNTVFIHFPARIGSDHNFNSHNTEIIYIDLARAKSEALINIYSLLKQNMKSCNAEWRRQQKGPKKICRSN